MNLYELNRLETSFSLSKSVEVSQLMQNFSEKESMLDWIFFFYVDLEITEKMMPHDCFLIKMKTIIKWDMLLHFYFSLKVDTYFKLIVYDFAFQT